MTVDATTAVADTTVRAPFSDEQVASLERWQHSENTSSFICGTKGCRMDLLPTRSGWMCAVCSFTQNWAHDFMCDFVDETATAPSEADLKVALAEIERLREAFRLSDSVEDFTEIRGEKVCLTPLGKIVEASKRQVKENERLREEIEQSAADEAVALSQVEKYCLAADRSKAEVEKLRTALAVFADGSNWVAANLEALPDIHNDWIGDVDEPGKFAREILAGKAAPAILKADPFAPLQAWLGEDKSRSVQVYRDDGKGCSPWTCELSVNNKPVVTVHEYAEGDWQGPAFTIQKALREFAVEATPA